MARVRVRKLKATGMYAGRLGDSLGPGPKDPKGNPTTQVHLDGEQLPQLFTEAQLEPAPAGS